MSTFLSLSIYWTLMVAIFIGTSVFLKKLETRKGNKAAIRVIADDKKAFTTKISRKS